MIITKIRNIVTLTGREDAVTAGVIQSLSKDISDAVSQTGGMNILLLLLVKI